MISLFYWSTKQQYIVKQLTAKKNIKVLFLFHNRQMLNGSQGPIRQIFNLNYIDFANSQYRQS